MSDVTTTHADYKAALPKWRKCEDAAAGEDAVKAEKETYLPRPNARDISLENAERYRHYVERAVFYNATGRTLQGLLGLAFAEPPTIALPPAIAYAQDDVSGSGLPLQQHAQGALSEVLKTARAGLLVDYPVVDPPVSVAQQALGDVRPTVTLYEATAITNWRTQRRAGKTVLILVVLKECYEEIDGFGSTEKTQYRVLRLDTTYQVEIWRQQKTEQGTDLTWIAVEQYSPVRGDGSPWTEIPFTFIGAQNNDENVDQAPLYDIAALNLAHYRNSADYEDSVFNVGQPTVWIAGLDIEWRDYLEKRGLYVGARAVIPLPEKGSAGIIQAQPNTLAKEAMDAKEKQMAALGARLIQAPTSVKTATQVDSEDAIAHSVLALCCTNLSAAYTQALNWFAAFANASEDAELDIPTDFSSYTLDAQTLTALLQGVQSGNIPQSDFWARMRSAGIIASDKTDEAVREELDSQPPLGAGVVDTTAVPPPDQSLADSSVTPEESDPNAPPSGMDQMCAAMGELVQALNALIAKPDPPAPVVNLPEINIAPAAVTVQPAAITFAPGSIQVDVAAAPAPSVTVESPTVNITQPDITVESPTINVAAPVVNVQAAPPMRTIAVRGPDGRVTETRQEPVPGA